MNAASCIAISRFCRLYRCMLADANGENVDQPRWLEEQVSPLICRTEEAFGNRENLSGEKWNL